MESEELSSLTGETQVTSETPAAASKFRGKLGLIVTLVGVTAINCSWFLSPDGSQTFVTLIIVGPLAVIAFGVWWLFSGLRWKTRLGGIGVFAVSALSFLVLFRIDGLEGDMFPRWKFRFSPSAEAQAEKFWTTQTNRAIPEPDDNRAEPRLEIGAGDWPGFRGPLRDGIVRYGQPILRDWDNEPPRLVWKHAVGPGWSSFAVVGRYAFTQEQRRDDEAVVCYDANTGRQIWAHTNPVRFTEPMGGVGPRATPTFFDSRLYTLGATGILDCLDARTGASIWSHNILEDAKANNRQWAMSGSPLVFDNMVVVNPGVVDDKPAGRAGQGVAAYDRVTGKKLWATGNRIASYCAPRIETIDGERQLLIFDAAGLSGHDPNTGKELWFREWKNGPQVNAAQPILLGNNRVFFSVGYSIGGMLLEVTQSAGRWSAKDVWTKPNRNLKLKFNDAVLKDGFIYGLDEGILVCLDTKSGKRRWKRGRYGYGQLLLIDDLLLIQAESGEVALVSATPDAYREITRFQALEGVTWNNPVFVNGRLFVRNANAAACYDLRPEQSIARAK